MLLIDSKEWKDAGMVKISPYQCLVTEVLHVSMDINIDRVSDMRGFHLYYLLSFFDAIVYEHAKDLDAYQVTSHATLPYVLRTG